MGKNALFWLISWNGFGVDWAEKLFYQFETFLMLLT